MDRDGAATVCGLVDRDGAGTAYGLVASQARSELAYCVALADQRIDSALL